MYNYLGKYIPITYLLWDSIENSRQQFIKQNEETTSTFGKLPLIDHFTSHTRYDYDAIANTMIVVLLHPLRQVAQTATTKCTEETYAEM